MLDLEYDDLVNEMFSTFFAVARSETIEMVLCESLFPGDFSVRDKVKNWVKVFSGFDKFEVKALEKIMEQKQSSVDLILERLGLEGSRRQAKYDVHALAAIAKDDGLMSLSVLYKRLVDMLEEKTHLPPILQSLGCSFFRVSQ
ncbi:hypothetical protein MKX03_016999 [Papaver bracteatum]|nr:hypothetical protein MKX03_016999 [Papaver bracteatum]